MLGAIVAVGALLLAALALLVRYQPCDPEGTERLGGSFVIRGCQGASP